MKFDRVNTPELLDRDDIPDADLAQNLRELAFINTYLGGHETLKKGLKQFDGETGLHVLEIGSGGGDNLRALQRFRPENHYAGVDLKPFCVAYSRERSEDIAFQATDYRAYVAETKPDVVFNSLFCHHFRSEDVVEMLRWMKANSRRGFFIGDLHRHPLAYWSIRGLTAAFSSSYLVKNDAPLSVRRGFTRKEWEQLLAAAGITKYTIRWEWAFRHLIVVLNDENE